MFRRVRIVELARSLIFLSLFFDVSSRYPSFELLGEQRPSIGVHPSSQRIFVLCLPTFAGSASTPSRDLSSRPILASSATYSRERALRLLLPLPNQRISHTMLQGRPPLPPSRTGNDDSNRSPSPSRLPALPRGEIPTLLMGLIKLRSPRWWVEPVPPLEHRGEDQTRRTKLIETLPLLSPLSRPKLSEKHSSSRSRWISIKSQLPSDCLSSRIRFVLPPDSSPLLSS